MKTLLISALVTVTALVGCDDTKATPKGQTVIEWDKSKASRASVKSAKASGESKSFKMLVEKKPDKGPSHTASFELDFEARQLEVTDDGTSSKHLVPTKVVVKVAQNARWEVTGDCDDGPHFKMPSVRDKPGGDTAVHTPEAMVLMCTLKLTGGGNKLLVPLQIYGDGTVNAMGDDIAVTER